MALVPCRECGKEVSDAAEKCPYCGISTPSKKRRQVKLIITAIVILLLIGGGAWAYHKVTSIFAPATAEDTTSVPVLDKTVPVKDQIIQKDYKRKVGEMIDSDKSVGNISDETGLSRKEIRKIRKEKRQKEKERKAAEEAAGK
ncbi:MAG: zinc ribbon domain-containing protein [Bacteroidetes bacterium]|nr:zinc ribbon domain-containing protein [Bacteroidota bacterium]